jgi:hypothetical protein
MMLPAVSARVGRSAEEHRPFPGETLAVAPALRTEAALKHGSARAVALMAAPTIDQG